MFHVKEIYYTLQGEGSRTGRPSVFCRFSGCNLWTGKEADRENSVCKFCDTDFIGVDGPGGGKYRDINSLIKKIDDEWPRSQPNKYLVFIQDEYSLKNKLIKALATNSISVSTSTPFENELRAWVLFFF